MLALAGLFIIDTISMESSIKVIQEGKPDYAILMPSCLPRKIVSYIQERSECPLIGGGLCNSKEDLDGLLQNGLKSAVTSEKKLWNIKTK